MPDVYKDLRDTYNKVAHKWDEGRNCTLFEKPWLDRVLARCPKHPSILYLGCGTGRPIAGYLIEQGAKITGVDFAEEMIDLAIKNYPDQKWIKADIRELDLNQRFDAVISFSALFHLTQSDQRAHFEVLRKHTKEGGAVFFASGAELGECVGHVRGHDVYHASLDLAEYRDLLNDHGFGEVEHKYDDPDCAHHTLWLASLLEMHK